MTTAEKKEVSQFTSQDKLLRLGTQLGGALRAAIDDPENEPAVQALGLAFSRMFGLNDIDQAMEFYSAFVSSFRGPQRKAISAGQD